MTSPLVAPVGASQFAGLRRIPAPINDPVRNYAPGSPERHELQARLSSMSQERVEIPLIIGGKHIHTGTTASQVMPHAHRHVVADYHKARTEDVHAAIAAAAAARREWAAWSWEDRAGVFLKAADLLTTTRRATLNAATILGQSKTVHQAEIDAACELVDFWRFNVAFAQELYAEQPVSSPGMWNQSDYRPLEGFIYAVTPFNFTAIGGNLAGAPALMGNTVIWKPAGTAMLSAWYIMQILEEAGLPPGVINLLPGDPGPISDILLTHRDLGGVHFTGSTGVFNGMWETIGRNMGKYRSYPRIVGETGGKDFIVAHPSADPVGLAVAIVRGGFEFQGQKCSAASRVYIPKSLWPQVRDLVAQMTSEIKVGDTRDFTNFMGAVIDKRAFDKHQGYLALAKAECEVITGGTADDELGYFVQPTFVRTTDPAHRMLNEEIFGPIVTAYVFDDDKWLDTLTLVDATSPYALTGAVWAREKQAVLDAMSVLRNAAGNFYINDKPTGAVVGQQPFGGARASGTNDKAGSKMNLMRWVSARTIKETFVPPTSWRYPFLDE
jgi:1-pyrroline-5-carboxylate dehydrogenase